MTKQIEALKLALEALERIGMRDWVERKEEAITALRRALEQQPADEPVACDKWEGAEYWMPLAWELCADECGEEACTELIWEGGPIPEPWGDRWLKYEDEAKRLIALVQKHTRPQEFVCSTGLCRYRKPLTDEEISNLWCKVSNTDFVTADTHEFARAIEAKLREKNHG